MKKSLSSVYVIKNIELNRVKIGYAYDANKRFSNIMTQSGCLMKLVYVSKKIPDFEVIEKDMHLLFNEYRGIGEWFNIGEKTVVSRLKDIIHNEECRIVKGYKSGKSTYDISYNFKLSKISVLRYLIHREIPLRKSDQLYYNQESNDLELKKNEKFISKNRIAEMVRLNNEKIKNRKRNQIRK